MSFDFAPFVAHSGSTRPYIEKPFNWDGNSIATNGHILVCVPLVNALDEVDPAIIPGLRRFVPIAKQDVPMIPLSGLQLPPAKDDGECSDCDGSGHRHQCPSCRCVCDSCSGAGRETVKQSVRVGGINFDAAYISLIASLPSAAFAKEPDGGPTRFVFDGGVGCLMPCSTPLKEDLGDILKYVASESR